MTIYAIGDFHGHSLEEFLEEESPEKDDRILSTGDFDQVEVIKEFLELKNSLGSESFVEVGGNHDQALLDRIDISSGTIKSQFKSYEKMIDELHESHDAKEYLREVLEKPYKEFQIGELDGVLVHGGLEGYLQNPELDEDIRHLWYRLWNEEDFQDNFDIMREEDYDLMIRGHDHWTEHAFQPKNSDSISYHLPDPRSQYSLDEDYRHIITHGDWHSGNYLKIDESSLDVEFRKI